MDIITTQQLNKTFDRHIKTGWFKKEKQPFVAVNNIDLNIQSGEKVAFIGPNGAGKSTTLKMLTGILQPTSGKATVAGHTPWKDRKKLAYEIGAVFGQRSQLWPNIDIAKALEIVGYIYDLDKATIERRIAQLSEMLEIEDLLQQTAKSLSLGQRMRCEIAVSLLHKPKIILLDEPTIGLDVNAKASLRDHLKTMANEEETTIMLTSHDTGDIEEICDRVIMINHGQIVIDKNINELKGDFESRKFLTLITEEAEPKIDLPDVEIIEQKQHKIVLGINRNNASLRETIASAMSQINVQDMTIENAPLEKIIQDLYARGTET